MRLRTMVTAGLVAAACFLGASLGTWLRFPGIGSAVIFPPYAVVTAALWKSPPRRWWVYLLAAGVGDFSAHRLQGESAEFAMLAELVNDSRAIIAAVGLRRFAGNVRSLREMVAYLVVAVLVAPCAGGLGGASLVTGFGRSQDFSLAWQQWWLSNTITALTILPLLTADVRRLVQLPRRTLLEIAGFLVSLVLVAQGTASYVHPARLYWALPFLLWSAVRFGWRATSAALLVVMVLSVSNAVDDLLELHVFLIACSTPLFILAVLTAELTESRRQYRSVVEDQTDLICRFRPDGTYTFANRAYCETFSIADITGKNAWNAVPAGVHQTRSELETLRPDTPIAVREVKVGADDQAARWLQWLERGLFDERGVAFEYQAVGRDITDRKRAEDEHRELEARRSVEVVLRDNDRRKDEFLAMLGHELRNPLAPMAIAVELLATADPSSSDARWAREQTGRQLRRLTRLVDDLLDLSRVTLGKIELQLAVVDVRSLVANAVDEARALFGSRGHELVVRLPDEQACVRADGVRLMQVIANLLHNAAKYTESGGRVVVTVDVAPADVRISVRDNGMGLDPVSVDMVFELFTQLPAGRGRAQDGLGIGLTLVKRLVELHGGSVVARSEGPDLGSEFVVTLPRTAPDATVPTQLAPVSTPTRAPLRVLAVDDNVDLAMGIAAVLRMWGHTVRTAHDGHAALDLASTFAPDVVLLDIGLPLLDGLEVARRLRNAPQAPALLVAISGFGEPHTQHRASEAGFHHHFVKPIDLVRLRVLLDDCARRKTV